MSAADVERLVNDLKKNVELRLELKDKATGIEAVADFAKSKGYDTTPQEIKDYIRSHSKTELSDTQLEAIAGGKSTQGLNELYNEEGRSSII